MADQPQQITGQNPPKRKVGRPTKYRKEYCEAIIRVVGEEGMPDLVFAGEIGVHQNVLDDWASVHPEFLCARKRAEALRARKHMADHSQGQARWIFCAKNWCGMTDKQEIQHSGAVGVTVDVAAARAKLGKLLERIATSPDAQPAAQTDAEEAAPK